MPADDPKGGDATSGRRRGPIRTAPLSDSGRLREALQAQLHQAVAPALMVISGPDVGLRVRLERSIEIGRDPTASFALRDESISWRHVRIEDRGAAEWACVDMGSTNGMLVNGEKTTDAILRNGDKIMLGKTILEFQLADSIREGFNAEVQRLLHQDDLSGLWVRRRFDAQLETAVKSVQAGSMGTVSVVVMDLDGVKGINDTHGHDMGAFVIGAAGHVIGEALRPGAFATRFGGDEFCAALPDTAKDDAVTWAEATRVKVVDHVYERGGVRVHPGMSCGVATVPADAADADGVFRAADQAMYRAKRAGKNRVST
jgi:diguanylate cyclase (GGDEF)-like protein